ncbi:hypothetical protein INR49_025560 [Caranx melampygus]|nr:hypothetical protein INR49_025560 [Caranx melampygus]
MWVEGGQVKIEYAIVCIMHSRSPLADRTNELTLTELRLCSVYLWSDGTHRHQSSPFFLPSRPSASVRVGDVCFLTPLTLVIYSVCIAVDWYFQSHSLL